MFFFVFVFFALSGRARGVLIESWVACVSFLYIFFFRSLCGLKGKQPCFDMAAGIASGKGGRQTSESVLQQLFFLAYVAQGISSYIFKVAYVY